MILRALRMGGSRQSTSWPEPRKSPTDPRCPGAREKSGGEEGREQGQRGRSQCSSRYARLWEELPERAGRLAPITLEDGEGRGTYLSWFENVVEGGYGAGSLVGATERGVVIAVRSGSGQRESFRRPRSPQHCRRSGVSLARSVDTYDALHGSSYTKRTVKSPVPRRVSPTSFSAPRTSLHLAFSLPSPPSSSWHLPFLSLGHPRLRSTP